MFSVFSFLDGGLMLLSYLRARVFGQPRGGMVHREPGVYSRPASMVRESEVSLILHSRNV